MVINCKVCGSEFTRYGKQAERAVCCSTKCLGIYNKAKPNTSCTNCGKDFHMKESRKNRYNRKIGFFCSLECNSSYRKIWFTGENNHQYGLRGDKNTSFKGNITYKNNHGFVDKKIYVGDNHPYADKNGRLLYHRHIVEENSELFDDSVFIVLNNKKYLKRHFDVHHIDGNHNNNDVSNLMPLRRGEHTRLHNKNNLIIRDSKGRISGVFKSGELLENLEKDNQQPS